MIKHNQLHGMKFGKLTAVVYLGKTTTWKKNVCIWKCKCDCKEGAIAIVASTSLIYHKTKSCGCLSRALAAERCKARVQAGLGRGEETETTKRAVRMWHAMRLGETRTVENLTTYQIQSQVGKVRKKHPECREWKWATATQADGSVVVTRVR